MMTPSRDGLLALEQANADFERRLRLTGPYDWVRPTPCSEWDVRALVNHVLGGNRRYMMLLSGATAADVDGTRTEDHLGPDPVAAFRSGAQELATMFGMEEVLALTVHHPIGERTGTELLAMRVLDVTVHSWDLSRALDVDDALDPQAVDFALDHLEVVELGRRHGSFAVPTSRTSATTPQDRLLHVVGRSPKGGHS